MTKRSAATAASNRPVHLDRRLAVPLALLTLLLVALAAIAFPGDGQAKSTGGISAKQKAERSLKTVERLFEGRGVRTGRELTLALTDLYARRKALSPADRKRADAFFARPTEGAADPGDDGYTVPAEPPVCSARFCVHYVASTRDAPPLADASGNGVPDYVDFMLASFDFVHDVEHGQLGWRVPPNDAEKPGDKGPGPQTDVYIKELADSGAYGFAVPEGPEDEENPSKYGYNVMDNNYSQEEYNYPDFRDPLVDTAAHEYHHLIQFGYDVLADKWFKESVATYMEEQVTPHVNDYVRYLGSWSQETETPLTYGGEDNKIYGSGIWNIWLRQRHGPQVHVDSWELTGSTRPASFAPAAYQAALARRGSSFVAEFNRFSAATAEWQSPGQGFVDEDAVGVPGGLEPNFSGYPNVERAANLSPERGNRTVLDHTTHRLFNVSTAGSRPFFLHVSVPPGVASGIALVGRQGEPNAGNITTALRDLPRGGRASVRIDNPQGFNRITAVLVNADASQRGYNNNADPPDWRFTRDRVPFGALISRSGRPCLDLAAAVRGVQRAQAAVRRARGRAARRRAQARLRAARATLSRAQRCR